MRRMDRYEENEDLNRPRRSNKNQELYENIGKNTRYTNFSDVTNANAYDITNINKNANTREEFRKMQEYSNVMNTPTVKKELEEFKNIYKIKENRVYDINSILEEARKNRKDNDDKDIKRKLKNDKYNILLSLNKEELEEYRKQRKERFMHPDEEELHNLIDTIASRTLSGEIDKETGVNLLSELMATSIMDKVDDEDFEIKEELEKDDQEITYYEEEIDEANVTEDNQEVTENNQYEEESIEFQETQKDEEEPVAVKIQDEIIDKEVDEERLDNSIEETEEEPKQSSLEGADTDFYTRSMDLSDKDFEIDEEFKEKPLPLALKIFFFLLFVAIIALVGYFIWKM